jgi:hypothetical protein
MMLICNQPSSTQLPSGHRAIGPLITAVNFQVEQVLRQDGSQLCVTTVQMTENETVCKKAMLAFNRVLYDLITDLRGYDKDVLAPIIKRKYKLFDKGSDIHIAQFRVTVEAADISLVKHNVSELMGGIEIIAGISVQDILDCLADQPAKLTVMSYVYILFMFYHLAYVEKEQDDSELLDACVNVLAKVQQGSGFHKSDKMSTDDICAVVEVIVDPDLRDLLREISNLIRQTNASQGSQGGFVGVPGRGCPGDNAQGDKSQGDKGGSDKAQDYANRTKEMLENSKIGSLAKELSEEIDVSQFNMDNPEGMFNFSDMGKPDNAMGKLASKVGSKIQQKIKNGELKQEDLFTEAMSLMSSLQNNGAGNPMFNDGNMMKNLSNMASMFAGGAGTPKVDNNAVKRMATLERLRSKHEKRTTLQA